MPYLGPVPLGQSSVGTDEITDLSIATADIANDAVTAAKLNADTAGAGLVPNGGTGALDVNPDGSTIEINADQLRVVSNGITGSHIDVFADSPTAGVSMEPTASTTLGTIIAPSMTTAQRDAINTSSPQAKTFVYNTTTVSYEWYDGTTWHTLDTGSLGSLTTTTSTNLVAAINEVDANADAAQTAATQASEDAVAMAIVFGG